MRQGEKYRYKGYKSKTFYFFLVVHICKNGDVLASAVTRTKTRGAIPFKADGSLYYANTQKFVKLNGVELNPYDIFIPDVYALTYSIFEKTKERKKARIIRSRNKKFRENVSDLSGRARDNPYHKDPTNPTYVRVVSGGRMSPR